MGKRFLTMRWFPKHCPNIAYTIKQINALLMKVTWIDQSTLNTQPIRFFSKFVVVFHARGWSATESMPISSITSIGSVSLNSALLAHQSKLLI